MSAASGAQPGGPERASTPRRQQGTQAAGDQGPLGRGEGQAADDDTRKEHLCVKAGFTAGLDCRTPPHHRVAGGLVGQAQVGAAAGGGAGSATQGGAGPVLRPLPDSGGQCQHQASHFGKLLGVELPAHPAPTDTEGSGAADRGAPVASIHASDAALVSYVDASDAAPVVYVVASDAAPVTAAALAAASSPP